MPVARSETPVGQGFPRVRTRNVVDYGPVLALCSGFKEYLRTWRSRRRAPRSKPLSKSAILQAVADAIGEEISRKHVKEVVETLVDVGHKELKKNGIFVLPGFAKFVVVKKPARPARDGHQPLHQGEAAVRGEAGEQGRPRASGQGHQGRGEVKGA